MICGERPDHTPVCWRPGGGAVAFVAESKPITLSFGGEVDWLRGCALTAAREVVCWDYEDDSFERPERVAGLDRVGAKPVQIDVSRYHACATLANSRVACWGENQAGQLGSGVDSQCRHLEPYRSFEHAIVVPKLRGVVQVSGGALHSCALDREGVVHCWGRGQWGALGRPPETRCAGPGPVAGLPAIIHISSDGEVTCALDREGSVYCWGSENLYQTPAKVAVPCRVPLPGPARDVRVVQGWGISALLQDGRELRWLNVYHCDEWYSFEYELIPRSTVTFTIANYQSASSSRHNASNSSARSWADFHSEN
jgi:hypothetical protein